MEQNTSMEQDSHRGDGMGQAARGVYDKAKETVKDTARDVMQSGRRGVREGYRDEGELTKQIERVTSQVPSATFLSLALASVGLSALLQAAGRKNDAQFIGQWVPTILILGLYNKLVKIEGSEH